MSWRDVAVLYGREVRAALRERTIVVNSILVPLLLYPCMMWAVFTGVTFVKGRTAGYVARTAVLGLPAEHRELQRRLETGPGLDILPQALDPAAARRQVQSGDLDALLEFGPPAGKSSGDLVGNFSVTLTFNQSRERSAEAKRRLTSLLDDYRDAWLQREGEHLGIGPEQWQAFVVQGRNVATGRQMGALILGLMLPLFFVIMVAMGCFFPAVDATAGERERGTWETTMSLAVSRGAVVTSKYLYVATFGLLAGTINLAAMTLSMGRIMGPLLGGEGGDVRFAVPLVAVPVLLLGAVMLAGFVAAGMLVFAAFARTFKEGQAMITPFYLLLFLPVMFLNSPGLEFTSALALVPVANVAMMIREAVAGSFPVLQILLTVASGLVAVAACIALAVVILRCEDVVIGSFSGSLGTFLRQRLVRRERHPAGAAEGV